MFSSVFGLLFTVIKITYNCIVHKTQEIPLPQMFYIMLVYLSAAHALNAPMPYYLTLTFHLIAFTKIK